MLKVLVMNLNHRKEQFSVAYLRAVAAVAGYSVSKPEVDDDSVDYHIAARGTADLPRRPRLDVQLKCSAQASAAGDAIRFPLRIKNYEDLRAEHLLVPRALVVVRVPERVEEWLRHSEEEMALRRCGYWLSLRGMPPSANQETVTVALPRSQQLTPEALRQMMRRINDGAQL